MRTSPDAIVIGAGVVGAATALALTNSGMKVLVIDRGNVASGTTGAGEGNILVSDKEPGPELDLALHSRNAWFDVARDVGNGDETGGFELEAKGGIVVARTQKGIGDLVALAQEQRCAGVDARSVAVSELRDLEPYLCESIENGVLYPQDSQCQPMLAAAQMMRVARGRGAEFLFEVAVKEICTLPIKDGNTARSCRVRGVRTDTGEFNSPIVINATGTWAGEVAKLAGTSLPIAPRRGFILVSAPAPKIIFHKVYDAEYVANVASGDAELQSSAVVESTQSGTILIGASRERVGFKSDLDVSVLRILAAQAIALFPILADMQLLRAYRGFRPYAPDHLPVIGEDSLVQGLWHNAGHEGAGIGLSPASAQLITELIAGRETFMDPTPFSPSRFATNE